MKKYVAIAGTAGVLFIYFFMILVVFPGEFSSLKVIEPQPTHSVSLSTNEITLGESFKIEVDMSNRNDFADILLTSVIFS